MITVKGYEIPNKVSELTVVQFDKLSKIENSSGDNLDKWIEKFTYLGVDPKVFDEMSLQEFKESIKEFNDNGTLPDEPTRVIEIDGYTYEASDSVGVKDLALIEKKWKKDRDTFTQDCIAVLFKRSDLGRNEHYDEPHIKHKKELFKDVKIEVALPYVVEIMKILTEAVEELNVTEELESDNG